MRRSVYVSSVVVRTRVKSVEDLRRSHVCTNELARHCGCGSVVDVDRRSQRPCVWAHGYVLRLRHFEVFLFWNAEATRRTTLRTYSMDDAVVLFVALLRVALLRVVAFCSRDSIPHER